MQETWLGLIPGLGRSPGGGHGNPLQYSCLENPHGQRSLVSYSPWGCKELDTTEWLSTTNRIEKEIRCYLSKAITHLYTIISITGLDHWLNWYCFTLGKYKSAQIIYNVIFSDVGFNHFFHLGPKSCLLL